MKRPLTLLTLAGLCLWLAALRHRFVWGGQYASLLGVAEGLLLVAFAVLGTLALHGRAEDRDTTWKLGLWFTALAMAAPPFLTTDVFDYVLRGRVEAIHGSNPYLKAPGDFPGDPLLPWCQWPGYVMPYGPISAALQAAIAKVGGGIWTGVYLWKVAMAACHLGMTKLLERVRPGDPAWLRLWLWNPFLVLELANGAHNDGLMALFLALMVERLVRGSMAMATLAFGCAVLSKHGCVVLGPLLLALAWRQRRLPAFGVGVVASALLCAAFAWHYFLAPGALEFLTKQLGNRGTSLQAFALRLLGEEQAGTLVKAGYLVVGLVLGRAVVRVRSTANLAREGIGLVLVFLMVAMPLFSPWYHLWWLPLAALLSAGGDRALRALAWAGPCSYAIFATTRSFALDHQILQWSLALVLPMAVVVTELRPRREVTAD